MAAPLALNDGLHFDRGVDGGANRADFRFYFALAESGRSRN